MLNQQFLKVRYTHTHTFNSPFSRTTQVSRYQKGKTNLDFTEARDSEWQWHQLGHMQVCTLLQTDNHTRTPPLGHSYSFVMIVLQNKHLFNGLFFKTAWVSLCHTHTHTHLTALFPGLPRWAGTRKVKPIWIILKQETVSGSGISWAYAIKVVTLYVGTGRLYSSWSE